MNVIRAHGRITPLLEKYGYTEVLNSSEEVTRHLAIRVDNKVVTVSEDHISETYNRGEFTGIMRGTIKIRGRDVPIQLITEYRHHIMDICAPFHYHSSCVQSFIGPFAAGHFYGKMTVDTKTFGWTKNTKTEIVGDIEPFSCKGRSGSTVSVWAKYQESGYTYVAPILRHLGHQLRHATDCHSTWYEYLHSYSVPEDVVRAYRACARMTAWYEVATGTKRLPVMFADVCGASHLDLQGWFDYQEEAIEEDFYKRYVSGGGMFNNTISRI
ncbi:hypothetical protein LTR22_028235 [Elasticomyces elasticus]|nr:hypothetical protein LTR22_028235 [Elasticomyces elasticus]